MKKTLAVVLILLAGFIGGSYVYISDNVQIAKTTLLQTNKRTAYRCLTDKQLFQQIAGNEANDAAENEAVQFKLKQGVAGVVEVLINYNGTQLRSFITFHELSQDSTGAEWRTDMEMSKNPFRRLTQYLQATQIHKRMAQFLTKYQAFAPKVENVYGMKIMHTVLTDSLLVTTKASSNSYPTAPEYYNLIQKLRSYIDLKKATAVNYPMLNVTQVDSNLFQTTVAIPVNTILPGNADISFRKMFPGNILTAEVTGGAHKTEQAFVQLTNYVADFQLVQPAIYFQSLATDRLLESDSSKWTTKLYYPIY